MPRESTDEDESKYSGISSNNEGIISRLKSSISSKSKKDRKLELMKENSAIKVRKVRNIENVCAEHNVSLQAAALQFPMALFLD